jgi:hypothetical protein
MSSSVITATMQITNTGGLDDYLTAKPQEILHPQGVPTYASMFSYKYTRITPYAKHTIEVPFNEKVDFGRTLTATLPLMGDLVHTIHLHFRLPQLSPPPPGSNYLGWVNSIGHAMIESIQLRIGETTIDTHTGLFMEIMDYLSTPPSKTDARSKSLGRYDTANVLAINALGEQDIYVPLQFWFNKKILSSLPVISLTGQTIKLYVKLRNFVKCVTYDGNVEPVAMPIQQSGIIIDYYMLCEPERAIFKNEVQDYLIEQWQFETFEINAGITTSRFPLDFTRCIKEIVFVLVETESEDNNDFFNFGVRSPSKQGAELVSKIGLAFDGKPRQEKISESYFRIVTPQRFHSFAGNKNIYCISFAENPEINQPTGTANFSRYDTVELLLDFVDNVPRCRLHVLGINYNKINISPTEGVQIEFMT